MLDKTFFKFAISFSVVIAVSLSILYFSGYFTQPDSDSQAILAK